MPVPDLGCVSGFLLNCPHPYRPPRRRRMTSLMGGDSCREATLSGKGEHYGSQAWPLIPAPYITLVLPKQVSRPPSAQG
ncbi:rCG42088 [Rattus norvegicus]|uniref:RCG42088 n=1 Tax=Rattus norvegicus TaxID=10116 RepID=A6JUW4_RAT|nr:rCG42088 [Rattus norvegicus]